MVSKVQKCKTPLIYLPALTVGIIQHVTTSISRKRGTGVDGRRTLSFG